MVQTIFYLSRILGKKAFYKAGDALGQTAGRIADLFVTNSSGNHQVIAVSLKNGHNKVIVDFTGFEVHERKGQFYFECTELRPVSEEEQKHLLSLKNSVLDRQVVDINGKKLVRVNDLRLATMQNGTFLMAVDVGIEGLLRRLGIAKPLKYLLKPFHVQMPNKLILWDEVENVDMGHAGIKLATANSKLTTLHVSDLADIIEDMEYHMQAEVFSSLTHERAADVLEELETDVQVNLIEQLSVEKAADVLEMMPADEAADILEEVSDERAEQLLSEMEKEASEEVRELLRYEDNEVGSLMSTDFLAFGKDMTVEQAFAELRRLKPESDTIYYLYVVDENERLIATVSLRDLVVSEPATPLQQIMNQNVIFVRDTDDINEIADIISKYSLLAVPVVDNEMILHGMVIIDDIVFTLLKARKKHAL